MGPAPARSVDGGSPPIGGPVGVVGLVHLAVCRHRSVVVDIVRVIGLSVVCRWSVGGCLYLFGMSAGRLFDGPGGASDDDAARIALLEAELNAARLQAEARRVENEQLREELATERARTVSGDAAGKPFSGDVLPSPATLAGMLATLEARQADVAARAVGEHGGDVGDVQVVGRDLVEIVEASRRWQGLCAAVQAEGLAGLSQVQHVPVLPAEVS